ncbi:MAG: chorismate lyase [Burkholderiaceae bacterium]|nr:chorismate lyase [Burkholderiaceae bacterium]
MSAHPVSYACWHRHVNAINPPRELRRWLTLKTSLTVRLRAHCRQFRVHLLQQRPGVGRLDEFRLLSLPQRCCVQRREVLLCCDEQPVVLAYTVVPSRSTQSDWPGFHSLGETSLGEILFGDPLVERGERQFARLPPTHPLLQGANANFLRSTTEYLLYSRRCLFRRKNGLMLVTEVFLPSIMTLPTLADR